MDQDTDCRYDLTSMYESLKLDEEKKDELVKYINAYDIDATNNLLSTNFNNSMSEALDDDDVSDIIGFNDIDSEYVQDDYNDSEYYFNEDDYEPYEEALKPKRKTHKGFPKKNNHIEKEITRLENPVFKWTNIFQSRINNNRTKSPSTLRKEFIAELSNKNLSNKDQWSILTNLDWDESYTDDIPDTLKEDFDTDIIIIKAIDDVYKKRGEIESDEAVMEIENKLEDQGITIDADHLGDMLVKSQEMIDIGIGIDLQESLTTQIDGLAKRYDHKDGYESVKDILFNIAGNGGTEVISKVAGSYMIESKPIKESIEEATIEDVNDFIEETKERFPGSEAIYDGDTNTIKITLHKEEELEEGFDEEDIEAEENYGESEYHDLGIDTRTGLKVTEYECPGWL